MTMSVNYRSGGFGNYDSKEAQLHSALGTEKHPFVGPGAKQSDKDDADINTIVGRFIKTGQVPSIQMPPTLEFFAEVTSYQDALELIESSRQSFMQLPADVRSEFENNPADFVDFASDPKNIDQLRKWGLAIPAPVVDTIPVVDPVV